jgi:hypothetical protein
MTTPSSTETNGKPKMTNDDWEDASIAVSADTYVNQLDAEMTLPEAAEPTDAEASEGISDVIVSDLSAFMEPVDEEPETVEDIAEPILTDLSMVMEPIAEETTDPSLTDLSMVMEPVTDENDIPAPTAAATPVGPSAEDILNNLNKTLESVPKPVQARGSATALDESTYVPDEDRYEDYFSDDVEKEELLSIDVLEDVKEDLEERASDPQRRPGADPISYGTGDEPVRYVSPRAALSTKFRHYIETRWYPQWKYYDDRAIYNKRRYITLQLSIALGAVAVPIIIGISFVPTWIPALISAMVAAFTAVENVMKYGDNWRAYRSAAEGLNHEKVLYEAMSGSYSRTNAPFRMFVERCEDVIAEETGRYFERNQEETNDARFESDVSSTE